MSRIEGLLVFFLSANLGVEGLEKADDVSEVIDIGVINFSHPFFNLIHITLGSYRGLKSLDLSECRSVAL